MQEAVWHALRRRQVTDTVAGILGEAMSPELPLMEAGLDSLGAVDLRNALSSQFSVELPATFTFDHPSVAAMADAIAVAVAPALDTAAGPHWRDNELVQRDFGEATSVAMRVVGMSCVYPGNSTALPEEEVLHGRPPVLYLHHIAWI